MAIVGVAKEIKNNENRVALTPAGAHALVKAGHRVLYARTAGEGSGLPDEEYAAVGAVAVADNAAVYAQSDIVVKVKEPLESEYALMREGQTLFTYLHLAPNAPLTKALLAKRITGVAYETVQLPDGSLPLLAPMSEVAGRMSIQVGATMLQKYNGGLGILLGGVPGVKPAHVVIVGGGTVGTNAAKMAVGMGARVTVLDVNAPRLAYLDDLFGGRVETVYSSEFSLAEAVADADLLIGAVLVAGARAPRLVSEAMVKRMKKGSCIVDVAIDQGGSIETIDRVTTHDDPCYVKHGVVHYSVANMPGAVPKTSTFALTGVTLPYLLQLADKGVVDALLANRALGLGLNTYQGKVTHKGVAVALGYDCADAETLLRSTH